MKLAKYAILKSIPNSLSFQDRWAASLSEKNTYIALSAVMESSVVKEKGSEYIQGQHKITPQAPHVCTHMIKAVLRGNSDCPIIKIHS